MSAYVFTKAYVRGAVLTDMTAQPTPTNPKKANRMPSIPASAFPTIPHMSRSRAEGMAWYCAVMAQARDASNDVARFAAGLGGAL